jgi:hypothetical protein
MPSDRAKKKKEKAAASKTKAKGGKPEDVDDDQQLHEGMLGLTVDDDSHERSCTGVLASHPQSRDVHIESFTLLYHGHELLVDTRLELNFGRWGPLSAILPAAPPSHARHPPLHLAPPAAIASPPPALPRRRRCGLRAS